MSTFLDSNYTFSLMIPCWYIIIFIMFFTKMYYEKKILKIVSTIIGLIILMSTGLLYAFHYSKTYIINWIFKTGLPFVLMLYLPVNHKSIEDIDKKDKRKFYIRVVVGLLIMFIPGSKCYASICSSIDPNEYKIAEFLIYFCGVITIFLNKYIMNKILRIKRWKM